MTSEIIGPSPPPSRVTNAARRFFDAASKDGQLLGLIADTVLKGDYIAERARAALEQEEWDESLKPGDVKGPRTKALASHRQELLEMLIARAVDNFQMYVVEIVREVLHAKPAILTSRDPSISTEYLLEFDTLDALTHDLIENKVNTLSYRGFTQLEAWCGDRGIPLVVPEKERESLIELIATRNLITHNRCIVDGKYLRTVLTTDLTKGELRKVEVDYYFHGVELLWNVVSFTDSGIAGKFGIAMLPWSPSDAEEEEEDVDESTDDTQP